MLGSMKSVGPVLLLLMSVLYVASSYSDFDFSHIGCKECNLQKNEFFSRDRQPVYQCMGCCFSRAYPTPLREKKVMMNPKNITSEAACCIANNSHWVRVDNLPVRNHTECSCGTCIYHKI